MIQLSRAPEAVDALRAFAEAAARMAAVAPRCARRWPHLSHVTGPDGSRLCWGVVAVDPQEKP